MPQPGQDLNGDSVSLRAKGFVSGRRLLFIRCGDTAPRCLSDYSGSPEVTVVLSLYREPRFPIDDRFWVFAGGLSKFHAAKRVFQQFPELLAHEGFAFFDPDVEIGFGDILRLFEAGSTHRLGVFQAAVSSDSYTYWDFLKKKDDPRAWRETSFVEVMAPFFSRAALSRVWDQFDESVSTWGLEFLWYRKCKALPIGVVNTISMRHAAVVDTREGPFYQYLKSLGVDPFQESRALRRKYANFLYKETAVPRFVPRRAKACYTGLCVLKSFLIRKLRQFERHRESSGPA